jgi:hydrogenase 3 maturation protease
MDWGIFRGRVAVVCVGSELSGDDALGLLAYERLKDAPGMLVLWTHTAPENFLDEILEYAPERVVVVDAADFGGRPGEIRLIPVASIQKVHFSTHRAPMRMFAERLAEASVEVAFVGVQAADTGLGEPVTPEVEAAAEAVASAALDARRRR